MSITKLNFASFVGKTDGTSTLSAAEWNNFCNEIQTTVNALIDGDVTENGSFYVNGEIKTATNGKVTLAAGSTYVLKGYLSGQVVIGSSTDEPTDDTSIMLDGVTIVTDSTDNACIMYAPAKQCLRVTLAKNSVNKLSCTNIATMTDSQKGCLWSENNMVVQGNGYLACSNLGGHGLKASEIRLWGNPHIYVSAEHDGIHGNKEIDICGGVYYITGCNDAFGTRAEEGTYGSADYKSPGKIMFFKGDIYAYNLEQNVLDSKDAGYIIGESYSIHTDVASANITSGISHVDPKVYFGGATFVVGTAGYTKEPEGFVKCYTDKDCTTGETTISAVDGVYTLTTAYCKITGYVEGDIVAPIKTTDVYVTSNAYVKGNIKYTYDGKKIGLYVKSSSDDDENSYTFIVEGDVVSSGNAVIEVKSGHFMSVTGSIKTGDFTYNDSKGVLMLDGDLTGDIVYVGTDEDASGKTVGGAFIVGGTVKTTLSSKFKKGYVSVLDSGLIGIFCADTLDVAVQSDLNGSEHVFYHKAKGIVIGGKTIENDDYVSI